MHLQIYIFKNLLKNIVKIITDIIEKFTLMPQAVISCFRILGNNKNGKKFRTFRKLNLVKQITGSLRYNVPLCNVNSTITQEGDCVIVYILYVLLFQYNVIEGLWFRWYVISEVTCNIFLLGWDKSRKKIKFTPLELCTTIYQIIWLKKKYLLTIIQFIMSIIII